MVSSTVNVIEFVAVSLMPGTTGAGDRIPHDKMKIASCTAVAEVSHRPGAKPPYFFTGAKTSEYLSTDANSYRQINHAHAMNIMI